MNRPHILVAGIGNIFLGDDAFGVEVAQRLLRRELPEGVRVVDFGIRGLDLTYALLDGFEAVILVDAAPRGGRPGTLYVLEPAREAWPEPEGAGPLIEPHSMDPLKVLRLAAALGGQVGRLLLVGCEPTPPGEADDMRTGMSEPVRAAVDEAVPLITSLVARILCGEEIEASGDDSILGKEVGTCHDRHPSGGYPCRAGWRMTGGGGPPSRSEKIPEDHP
ncbi:MAG: hydrogenase maturation protease [Isosphaeraceae bacterium]|nr:hydrogenase maturation protease [Isosphaeraceae bacterium]